MTPRKWIPNIRFGIAKKRARNESIMNKNYITELREYSISVLREGNRGKSLSMLAKYNCSEVSRLVGLKVIRDLGILSKPFILKGDVLGDGIDKDNIHDILGFFDEESSKFILVDPTIWQFLPRKRNIFLGEFNTLDEAITFSNKFYEGEWEFSEYVDEKNEDVNEMKRIIMLNCDQAPDWEGK